MGARLGRVLVLVEAKASQYRDKRRVTRSTQPPEQLDRLGGGCHGLAPPIEPAERLAETPEELGASGGVELPDEEVGVSSAAASQCPAASSRSADSRVQRAVPHPAAAARRARRADRRRSGAPPSSWASRSRSRAR